MSAVNDENSRPNNMRPSDSDRARYGFSKDRRRLSQAVILEDTSTLLVRNEPEEELASGACSFKETTLLGGADVSVELVSLLKNAFGNTAKASELLRSTPTANKYDFKARNRELSDQNRALKAALAERLQGERKLTVQLAAVQADLAQRLTAACSDATSARRELMHSRDERNKLINLAEERIKDAVRAGLREEAAAIKVDQEVARNVTLEEELRDEVHAWKLRATRAEASTRQAHHLVEEAGSLLQSQAEACELRHRTLEGELAAAFARIGEMEAAAPQLSTRWPGGTPAREEMALPATSSSCE
jgi:hypothetical protein